MKKALIQLHIAVFLWGFTGVLGRLISLNEGLLVWWRIAFTLIILAAVLIFKKEFIRIKPAMALRLGAVGCLLALHWVCFFGSIKAANVSIALTCLSSAALLTAFLEPVFTRKKFNPVEIALGLMGLAGILFIFHFEPKFKTGIIIGCIASLLSVLFTLFNKKYVHTASVNNVMLYELGGGWILLTALMPLYLYYFPANVMLPTLTDVLWLTVLSGICTVVAMNLSLHSLKKISAFTQNLTLNLEPVYGIILAFFIYNEQDELSGNFYIGFALILLAVALQMLRIVKRKNT